MSQPPDHPPLALFQSILLELLDDDLPPDEILTQLREEPRLADYRDYIDTMEPRMVEVASKLTKRWGRRAAQP